MFAVCSHQINTNDYVTLMSAQAVPPDVCQQKAGIWMTFNQEPRLSKHMRGFTLKTDHKFVWNGWSVVVIVCVPSSGLQRYDTRTWLLETRHKLFKLSREIKHSLWGNVHQVFLIVFVTIWCFKNSWSLLSNAPLSTKSLYLITSN